MRYHAARMPRNLHARCVRYIRRYFQFAKPAVFNLTCWHVDGLEHDDHFLAFTENAVDAQRLDLQIRGVFVCL